MRTEVLRYLLEVDEQKSISKAANNLYISKSALSESISQLEKELNLAIFQRSKKGVTTTPAGEKILEQIRVVLDDVEKISRSAFRPRRWSIIPAIKSWFFPIRAAQAPRFRSITPSAWSLCSAQPVW